MRSTSGKNEVLTVLRTTSCAAVRKVSVRVMLYSVLAPCVISILVGCAEKNAGNQGPVRSGSNFEKLESPRKKEAVAKADLRELLRCMSLGTAICTGMASQEIHSLVSPHFHSASPEEYLLKHPFTQWLPKFELARTEVWRTVEKEPSGWPRLLICVFSDQFRTNLVDAYLYDEGTLLPVVNGLFEEMFWSIQPGDDMEKVYHKIGKRHADYYRGKDGKWYVKFLYRGYKERFYFIEAESGSGRVIKRWDGTI